MIQPIEKTIIFATSNNNKTWGQHGKYRKKKMKTNSTTTKKVKVTIVATDKIGREESITLMLNGDTASRLINAISVREKLNEMIDEARYYNAHFTKSQLNRLNEFDSLINNKFYNYTLSIAE